MANLDGFSLKGVGSVVSLSGSRRDDWNSPFFCFFDFFPFPSFSSTSLSTSVCSPVDLTFESPFSASSPEEEVPIDHILLCLTGSFSPTTWRVSRPELAVGLFSLSANVDCWAGVGEEGVWSKWTEELLVSVGEGGTAPFPFPLAGERREADCLGGVEWVVPTGDPAEVGIA